MVSIHCQICYEDQMLVRSALDNPTNRQGVGVIAYKELTAVPYADEVKQERVNPRIFSSLPQAAVTLLVSEPMLYISLAIRSTLLIFFFLEASCN